ncbi:hypothetical protein RF11_07980 [Thelohanellus kitauei]|uniref:EGF-like domain-containing protein n=1 Tax=Thelohanellus kitauei TaxID=669202 RepID=A0A0C2JGC0_THEKT|nr:hypothetical protein RF11_07980 [Thelohanellus kitauei]
MEISLISNRYLILMAFVGTLYLVVQSQRTRISQTRDLKITVFGSKVRSDVSEDSYKMVIVIDGLFITSTPLPFFNDEFRVDEHPTDYIKPDFVFKEEMWVLIMFTKSPLYPNLIDNLVVFNKTVKLFPDRQTMFNANPVLGFHVEGVIFTLTCQGYIGYNCIHRLLETEDETTDFDTGMSIYKNPRDHMAGEKVCSDLEDKICLNEGSCVKSTASDELYCNCKPGFVGRDCMYEECPFIPEEPLSYEELECFDKCEGTENKFCCNNAKCAKVNNKLHCMCDRTRFAGKQCEYECSPKCKLSYCTYDQRGPYCFISNEYADKYPEMLYMTPLKCKTPLIRFSPICASRSTGVFRDPDNRYPVRIILHPQGYMFK